MAIEFTCARENSFKIYPEIIRLSNIKRIFNGHYNENGEGHNPMFTNIIFINSGGSACSMK